ncbi:hypothetical protein [Paenibacillus xerothermodurans]|uniref:hypothetical protein n=1 Tax=Paenibacillus xerothermodurans TaxID=1977292 RepID=UPI0010577BBC|nr:hypothetical protein [Paenibacillus xerothermodurans]
MEIIIGLSFILILLITLAWISIRHLMKGIRNRNVLTICKALVGVILVIGSSYFVYTMIQLFLNAPGSDFR